MTLTPAETPVRTKMNHKWTGIYGHKTGQSGPPGNANAFRNGLAAVPRGRANGALTVDEQDIRADILAGLIPLKVESSR
jgi:hypothetical protein